jgi:hypothetical protein
MFKLFIMAAATAIAVNATNVKVDFYSESE